MKEPAKPTLRSARSIQVGVIALYVFCGAMIVRSLTAIYSELPEMFVWYAGLDLVFLLLFFLVNFRPSLPKSFLYAIYLIQSIVIVCLVLLPAQLDFLTALFILLSYQMALVLPGNSRWVWCGIFCTLILISLIASFGLVLGLALCMTPIAGTVVILTYAIAISEEEQANWESEGILEELQKKNIQLKEYNSQVEQIATIEERNRLARELHDSVSQTMFSIVLNTRSTQILMESDPGRVRPQLEELQILTQEALAEMRTLIAKLRPTQE